MKKTIFIVSMLLAGAVIIGISCKKENKEAASPSISENQNECTTCEDGKELALKIKSFDNSLQLARKGEKSGETLPLEDAIDQMELLINASHGFPFEEYETRIKKRISLSLIADGEGRVSLEQVTTAYDQMLEDVREAYSDTELEAKGLAFVGLALNDESKGGDEIEVNITIGGNSKEDPFDECWYYGELLGKCDGSMAWISDAAQEIWPVVESNNPILTYNDCPGPDYRLIVDPMPNYFELQGNEFEDIYGNKLLFWLESENGQFTEDELQLSVDEMNHYYNNELEVVYNLKPQQEGCTFPEYILVEIFMEGNRLEFSGSSMAVIRHSNRLKYARRYWVETGIIPDPTPID